MSQIVNAQSHIKFLLTAALVVLVTVASGSPGMAESDAATMHPLAPPDTSSPRATLTSFLSSFEEAYRAVYDDRVEDAKPPMRRLRRCFDLGNVSPRLARALGNETSMLLKETFDRIVMPDLAQVPDRAQMLKDGMDEWRVPKTDITIARVREGPREGEYLFDRETVRRAPEFYQRIRYLPYRPGSTEGIYEAYIMTPGLGIDLGWARIFPAWASVAIFEQALWQWISLVLIVGFSVGFSLLLYRLGLRWDSRRTTAVFQAGRICAVVFALAAVFAAEIILDEYVNITGGILRVMMESLTLASHGLIAWLAFLIINRIPEAIVSSRHLRPRSVDSQLIRLGFRLLTFLVLAGVVMDAADDLGFPAYSILTGVGVGGLAFALAARETLANFLSSITIMWDRPYQIGDSIVVGEQEGTVEDIGFRSTKIRTFYDSVLSIPNSDTVNATVDNMGRRRYRRIRTFLSINYETPAETVEAFLEGIKNIIRANPNTRKDYFNVVLHNLGGNGFEIMLYFFIEASDYANELVARQRVLLEVARLAEAMSIRLAFPTRTLHVEEFRGASSDDSPEALESKRLNAIAQGFGPAGEHARPRGSGLYKLSNEKESE
jgi:small-conductance mechanosensitive channel